MLDNVCRTRLLCGGMGSWSGLLCGVLQGCKSQWVYVWLVLCIYYACLGDGQTDATRWAQIDTVLLLGVRVGSGLWGKCAPLYARHTCGADRVTAAPFGGCQGRDRVTAAPYGCCQEPDRGAQTVTHSPLVGTGGLQGRLPQPRRPGKLARWGRRLLAAGAAYLPKSRVTTATTSGTVCATIPPTSGSRHTLCQCEGGNR